MNEAEKLIIVFSGSVSQADLVQHILEVHGIDSFLRDEIVGTIYPMYVAPGSIGAVKVEVAESDADKALSLIKEMASKKPPEESAGESWKCPKCGEVIEAQFNECWSCQTPRPKG